MCISISNCIPRLLHQQQQEQESLIEVTHDESDLFLAKETSMQVVFCILRVYIMLYIKIDSSITNKRMQNLRKYHTFGLETPYSIIIQIQFV